MLSLLYGQGDWPKFDPGIAAYTIQVAVICRRLSLTKGDVFDSLKRLACNLVRITSGNRILSTPLLEFFDLGGRDDGRAMFIYAIPKRLNPHLAAIRARFRSAIKEPPPGNPGGG